MRIVRNISDGLPSCEKPIVHSPYRTFSLLNYRGLTVYEPGSDIPFCSARECWVLVADHYGNTDHIMQWFIVHGFALEKVDAWDDTIQVIAAWGDKLMQREALKYLEPYEVKIDAIYRE